MTSEIHQSFRWQPVWFSPMSWWGMSMSVRDFDEWIPLFPVFPVNCYLELWIWDNLDWITLERLFHRCCWLHQSLGKTFLGCSSFGDISSLWLSTLKLIFLKLKFMKCLYLITLIYSLVTSWNISIMRNFPSSTVCFLWDIIYTVKKEKKAWFILFIYQFSNNEVVF